MNHPNESTDLSVIQANVLDHAPEFVEIVYTQAPGTYRALLSSGRFDRRIAKDPAFNHGKLFAYAEFAVFRREFRNRFVQVAYQYTSTIRFRLDQRLRRPVPQKRYLHRQPR